MVRSVAEAGRTDGGETRGEEERDCVVLLLQVDPKNEATWSSWIQMEEDMGRLEAANELRIRSSEQQWEFVIPASFSTRTAGGSDAGSSVLQSLLGTLNRFFSIRSSSSSTGGSSSAARSSAGRQQLMAELLPSDYRTDLTLNDIINEASALETGSSSSSNGSSNQVAAAGQPERQQLQQQQDAALYGSNGSSSSSDARRQRDPLFQRQRQRRLDQAAGLQQRPSRPPPLASRSWD